MIFAYLLRFSNTIKTSLFMKSKRFFTEIKNNKDHPGHFLIRMKPITSLILLLIFAVYVIGMSEYIFSIHMTQNDLRNQLVLAQNELISSKKELSEETKKVLALENYFNLIIRNLSAFVMNNTSTSVSQGLPQWLSYLKKSYNELQCKVHQEVSGLFFHISITCKHIIICSDLYRTPKPPPPTP